MRVHVHASRTARAPPDLAQAHYPFENKEAFEASFPADFIAEGIDQTRGWFYTLMVLSTALFDKPAFKNLICNGLVLAEDGRKMSKRLKNYPDPQQILASYGADALRLYLINSPVVRADDLAFKEKGADRRGAPPRPPHLRPTPIKLPWDAPPHRARVSFPGHTRPALSCRAPLRSAPRDPPPRGAWFTKRHTAEHTPPGRPRHWSIRPTPTPSPPWRLSHC